MMDPDQAAEQMAAILAEVEEGRREEVLGLVRSGSGLLPVDPKALEIAWELQRDFLLHGNFAQAVVESLRPEFVRRVDATRECLPQITRVHMGPSYSSVRIFVPPGFVPFKVQMQFVVLGSQTGTSYLTETTITNDAGVETPDVPCLAYDIEDGAMVLGQSPRVGSEKIARLRRVRAMVAAGIALVLHEPQRLKGRDMYLPGSRYKGYVPNLCLGNGRPALSCSGLDGSDPKWGAASLGGILVPGA